MKTTIVLILIAAAIVAICGCIAVNPTATPVPTAQPTVQPTAHPTVVPTVTPVPTPIPEIIPFPLGYSHSLYGYCMETQLFQTTRPGDWRGVPVSAVGEVYVKTRLEETQYRGYIQADGSYLIDGIPTGDVVIFIKLVMYRSSGSDVTVAFESNSIPFGEYVQRTRTDIP